MRFQDTLFSAQNLTDFMEICIVTTEIQYLACHWIRNHHKRQEPSQHGTPEWEQMLEEQPLWRHTYLRIQELYEVYKAAPREIRADPLYYPTERTWKWGQWEALRAKDRRISYNFLVLPDKEYTTLSAFQGKMVNMVVEAWNLIPDPAIVATCRFLKLILLLTKLPNYNKLEATSMHMNYNLYKGPELQQTYHYFHKGKYIGGNYMITFEDMFDTKF